MKTCPVCQKVLTDQAKFCFFCGASLLNVDAEPAAPAADPEPAAAPEASEPTEVFAPSEPEPLDATEPEPVVEPEPEPVVVPEPAPAPKPAEPEAKQPIVLATDSRSLMTTAGYIFTMILFHIPVIGLIFMIVWGCGKTKNLSRKRFSLAWLILRLIGFIVLLCAAVFLLICFSGMFPGLSEKFNTLWEAIKAF